MSKAPSRFAAAVSDDEEQKRRNTAIPEKTKCVTDWGIRVWSEWAANRSSSSHDHEGVVVDVNTPLLEIPATDFAYWLGKFILEVRKTDGSEYPPKLLYALVCCFKRFFEQNGVHGINPLNTSDVRFRDFRATIDSEMKRLHRLGLGMNSKQAEPILDEEEALLWTSGQLGTHSAHALLNSVYYYNCKVFGLRSYDEHRQLLCAQFQKGVDKQHGEYLQ